MKKVSILIPCYNSERYIRETLNCCIQQTYANVEIVVVDDGSKDKSFDIIREYESDRVKIFRQPNSGACSARNLAYKKSTGDYIIYLDADDIINPIYVEEHMKRISIVNQRDVTFAKWGSFKQSIEEAVFQCLSIYNDYPNAFDLLLNLWMTGKMLQTSCYMVSRILVEESGGWDETILNNQDGDFFSRILIIAHSALFVPKAEVFYRQGNYMSVSKPSNESKVASKLYTHIKCKENALKHEDTYRVRKALSSLLSNFIYQHGNKYPRLYKEAKEQVNNLGVGYVIQSFPDRVRKFCGLIGFENFMLLRKLIYCR